MYLVSKLVGNWLAWVKEVRAVAKTGDLVTRNTLSLFGRTSGIHSLSQGSGTFWDARAWACAFVDVSYPALGCLLPRRAAGLLDLGSFRGLWVLYTAPSCRFHISYVYPVAPLRVCAQQVTRMPPVVDTEAKDPPLSGVPSRGWCWPWRMQTCGCVVVHCGSHR